MKKQFIIFSILFLYALSFNELSAQEKKADIIVGETQRLKSKVLGEERTIQIALPASYVSSTSKYPVLYVLDGGSNFRFTADIARYLSTNSAIPELIVIGISSPNRNMDFIPSLGEGENKSHERSGKADSFLDFIQTEVIPYIDTKYRTLNYRVIAGHSLGGLFVIHAFITKPDVFSAYISSSPSLWWNNQEYMDKPQQFYAQSKTLNKNLFISLANESEDKPEFYTQLENSFSKNKPNGLTVNVRFYKDKNHITSLIEATTDGLSTIFSSWVIPMEEIFKADVSRIKDFYKKLSDKQGFVIQPSSDFLNNTGYQKLQMRDLNTAIEIFKYYAEIYPKSSNAFDSLGEAYMIAGNKELAIENYEKSLELNPQNTNAEEQLKKLKNNMK